MLRLITFGLALLGVACGFVAAQEKKDSKPTPAPSKAAAKSRADLLVPGYTVKVIEGFTVLISEETKKNDEASTDERKPLAVLELELKTIVGLFPPRPLNALRSVLIWVEWDEKEELSNGRDGAALAFYYGGHQLGLLRKGKHPLKAKNVTVMRMKVLTAEHQPTRDSGRCVLLHEIAHAVHDQLLGFENIPIKAAYKQAMERKLYDPKMYVSTNEAEYFAELSCAYFNQLHHYPKTRTDLKKHDPVAFTLLENVWGKRKDDVAAKTGATGSADLAVRRDEIDLGKPIVGPKWTQDDLKGRPVVLLLWNAGSSSCLACLPKLNAWATELGDFGLAAVGIHLTGATEQEIKDVALSRGVSFAVTEGRWTAASLVRDFKDFPLCLVFDHEGQCVFRGSPFDCEAALREAVGEAAVAATGKEEFPKALQPIVEALRKGKSPTGQFAKLAPLTRSKDEETAEIAKLLLAKLTEAAHKELKDVEPVMKEDPVAALLRVERLPAAFKDTSVATKANDMLAKLRRDPAVSTELRARPALATIKKLDTELGSRPGSFEPTSEKFRKDNVALLLQLQNAVAQLKRAWPKTKSAEDAARIAERYGLTIP